jgi:hypothetical protein
LLALPLVRGTCISYGRVIKFLLKKKKKKKRCPPEGLLATREDVN